MMAERTFGLMYARDRHVVPRAIAKYSPALLRYNTYNAQYTVTSHRPAYIQLQYPRYLPHGLLTVHDYMGKVLCGLDSSNDPGYFSPGQINRSDDCIWPRSLRSISC